MIVGVATKLGLCTVAEGVKTEDQLATVTRLGLDDAQGYLVGEPARTPVSNRTFSDALVSSVPRASRTTRR